MSIVIGIWKGKGRTQNDIIHMSSYEEGEIEVTIEDKNGERTVVEIPKERI